MPLPGPLNLLHPCLLPFAPRPSLSLTSLEKGTTYNAYLIFGETHTALVDASHEKFGNLFIQTLKEQLKAAGRGIDYVLVRCLLPTHSCMHAYMCYSC